MKHKGLEVYGWCIMTSHVHMIIGTRDEKLEDIVRDMKRHTSEQLKAAIKNHYGESRKEWMLWMMERAGRKNSNNISFQLWQQDNHPILLSTPAIAWQKLDYIHNNPVEAGIVTNSEDYLYSSARNYWNVKGLFEIRLLDPIERAL
jgi:REP element-mobilizing transposase RayT